MKGPITVLLPVWMTFMVSTAFSQNVSINTTGNVADTSAILDVSSTSKGIFIPRMSQAQRTAIFSPAEGLLAYQHDRTAGFYFHNSSLGWTPLLYGNGSQWATTTEVGAVEFDATNCFATSGTSRYTFAKTLTATATLAFPSTGTGASTLSFTLNGAADGDVVSAGVPNANSTSLTTASYTAYVSAANTVAIKFVNGTPAAIDPPSGVSRVSIIKC